MNDVTALVVAGFSIGFTILVIAWVTILPSIGTLYLMGYLH